MTAPHKQKGDMRMYRRVGSAVHAPVSLFFDPDGSAWDLTAFSHRRLSTRLRRLAAWRTLRGTKRSVYLGVAATPFLAASALLVGSALAQPGGRTGGHTSALQDFTRMCIGDVVARLVRAVWRRAAPGTAAPQWAAKAATVAVLLSLVNHARNNHSRVAAAAQRSDAVEPAELVCIAALPHGKRTARLLELRRYAPAVRRLFYASGGGTKARRADMCALRATLMQLQQAAPGDPFLRVCHFVRADGSVRSSSAEVAAALCHYHARKERVSFEEALQAVCGQARPQARADVGSGAWY
jgi:hypothetical protein